MSAVCLIDTSIFAELLNIPGMTSQRNEILEALQQKINANESLFLPMATIFETGNHIAHNGDGTQRRQCAERFVVLVQKALDGTIPFTPLSFPTRDALQNWLAGFPDSAMRASGIGDLSIVHDWERQCRLHQGRRIYIWSLDAHLSSHAQPATI